MTSWGSNFEDQTNPPLSHAGFKNINGALHDLSGVTPCFKDSWPRGRVSQGEYRSLHSSFNTPLLKSP